MVPAEFWSRAIRAVKNINPDVLFLGESISPSHEADRRRRNVLAVGPRLWISRTLFKPLLKFKDGIEIPFECQGPC
jgi:hypothetical protein